MAVVFHQMKNGLPALWARSMKSRASSVTSSSIVSMRFFVSGPVSSIFCLPTRPQRGCLGRIVLLGCPAVQNTPRGPIALRNSGSFG